jgi:multisubunit Na+/H+ antiporter MnhC subunit
MFGDPQILPELLGLSIPLVAIVLAFGIGMLAIYLDYRKRREMFSLYHQERMAAIEKGIELPPLPEAFFDRRSKPRSPHRNLLRGLVLLFIGLALFVALLFNNGAKALFALIIAGPGLALVIFYSMVEKKQIEADARKKADAAPSPPVA